MWALVGCRGLRNEARMMARVQLLKNVECHNKDFGFHIFLFCFFFGEGKVFISEVIERPKKFLSK